MDHNDYSFDSQYGYEQPPKQSRSGGIFATIVIVVVVVLLIALVIGLFMPYETDQSALNATPTPTTDAAQSVTPEPSPTPVVDSEDRIMPELDGITPQLPGVIENPIPDIFDAVSPGVVGIVNYQNQIVNGREQLQIYGSGSGFIVSTSGYVLTNAHVVQGANVVTVRFADGEETDAIIIGTDTETDVAVLKIEKAGLCALELGDSDAVRVGEYVLAIGNPLDSDRLANTLTFGIISATSREITIDTYTNTYLPTDAAINFGNSGGPLLNMQGQVIGMNSAKTVTAGYDAYGNAISAEGIGFALLINKVRAIMQELVTKGYIERPGIGITVTTVTETVAEAENLPLGAYVVSVVRGGPSDLAGVQTGDVIVAANGIDTPTQTELVAIIGQLMIGDQLTLRIYREGQYIECVLTVANKSNMDFDDTAQE